jgi:hypothetical protein
MVISFEKLLVDFENVESRRRPKEDRNGEPWMYEGQYRDGSN